MYVDKIRWTGIEGYIYFIDTLGNICAEYNCPMTVGAGVRHHVTMDANQIDYVYSIKTKINGNGTVKSVKYQAKNGEKISFSIVPNNGYVLKEAKITDLEGNEITFTDNEFTMPSADVVIEVFFIKEKINPETTDKITLVFIFIIISAVLLGY